MKNKENLIWLSIHLFQNNDINSFITKALPNYLKKNKYLISKYFFIRYSERGPHLRLRIKANANSNIKMLSNEYFQEYFRENTSYRKEPILANEFKWYPNDSIQWIDYIPEIERYGGNKSMIISEEQFYCSSKTIMQILNENPSISQEKIFAKAIQLHISLCSIFKIPLGEMKSLFNSLYKKWLALVVFRGEYNSKNEIQSKNIQKAFYESYITQKNTLVKFISEIIIGLQNGYTFNEAWFCDWIKDIKDVEKEIRVLVNEGEIRIPEWFFPQLQNIKINNAPLIFLLDSYIHMTNNRLGLKLWDEAYLNFIIKSSLEEIF